MKISLLPLYSQLNPGPGSCPLGCQSACTLDARAPSLKQNPAYRCPLSSHQAQTCAHIYRGDAGVIFNTAATADGKSLAAYLAGLLDPEFRIMGLYPTIELVSDQYKQQKHYHQLFELDAGDRVDLLYGAELARRESNKFQELLLAIEQKPFLLTNPDIFHLVTHFRYTNPATSKDLLPISLAEWFNLWVFDEFHIFGAHQEAAVLNSLTFIRHTRQRPPRFLFTSATPKPECIHLLKQAGFRVEEVAGKYASEHTDGFRQILQRVNLEFIDLKNAEIDQWIGEAANRIREILEAESQGRGLIILNSIGKVNCVVRLLEKLLPGVVIKEISGRIDRQERSATQEILNSAQQQVIIVATSAVDVGVDFKINLLIFEGSDSATCVQRLGRLGRHSGFQGYHAFVLLPGRAPWILARLKEELKSGDEIERDRFREAIEKAFDSPQEFQEYRQRWGAVQAQGMFIRMGEENGAVMEKVRERMIVDLQCVYGGALATAQKQWFALGETIQTELLNFRGGSDFQAAVWDGQRFYTYHLLRLLPYVIVKIIDRQTFIDAALRSGHAEAEFPSDYINTYLKIEGNSDERFRLDVHCSRDDEELTPCKLSVIGRLRIEGHPQTEVSRCLGKKKFLAFLVPLSRSQSPWDVIKKLYLNPTFGLYRLTDATGKAYACAFNQDALLLEALKARLASFCRNSAKSTIF